MKRKLKGFFLKIKPLKYYNKGFLIFNDPIFIDTLNKSKIEISKKPSRTTILNFLLSINKRKTSYLEIGVRNPEDNFNYINATNKYSVDPGLEYQPNPVEFKMTSDTFFNKLSKSEILSKNFKFDVIFIDGLHLAEQADRDIYNSLNYIKDDGFIVLHDCNPATEWHAREENKFWHSPAQQYWNGTTWKAFLKWRSNSLVNSCCIDSDWGVGILSKNQPIGESIKFENFFYEFNSFKKNRQRNLNLIDFETFKTLF